MILVVVAQVYVADIIGKLPEKFYRVDSGEVRLLDVEHHMKIHTEARFQLVHKLRRLPVMMDNIFLCEDYPLLLCVADKQAKTLGVFVRADIHRQLCAVEHDYFRAYRRCGGIIFFVKLPVIVEAALILAEEDISLGERGKRMYRADADAAVRGYRRNAAEKIRLQFRRRVKKHLGNFCSRFGDAAQSLFGRRGIKASGGYSDGHSFSSPFLKSKNLCIAKNRTPG